MYKQSDRSQSSFLDFNQPMGLHMNPNNRWVKMADSVPWDVFEKKYSRLFCREHGIRLSGSKLGRPNPVTTKTDKKLEYQDNTDRIAVEREFSREKRCYGLGKIVTKLEKTQRTSIALSVFVASLFKIQRRILFVLFYWYEIFKKEACWLSPCGT